MFSTFPESLYSTAGNSINNKGDNRLQDSQPIPATIRRPYPEAHGSVDRQESPELLRVRSPQSLQRVAFDIATLRQPFQSTPTKNGNVTDKSEEILSDSNETESRRKVEVASVSSSNFASDPTSSRTEISRKTETLVA